MKNKVKNTLDFALALFKSAFMTKTFKRTILATTFAGALVFSAFAQDAEIKEINFGDPVPLKVQSEGATHSFMVEIADTPDKLTRGLMYRDEIKPEQGMLFQYDGQDVLSIWMKNTGVPLDIIFIRKNGKILKIEHSATPYSLRSISSEASAIAVLELAGGRSLELGIMPGDVVKHEFFGNVDASE